MFEETTANPIEPPPNLGKEIRSILSGALPSHFPAEPLKSLRPTIEKARSGDWESFDKEPRKAKMFALLSIIIDNWWQHEVTRYRTTFPAVHGLATFDQNARGRFVRPLSAAEWRMLTDAPADRREYAASQCQITTMLAATTLLEARLSKPGCDIELHGRGARRLFLTLADEEVPGVGRSPNFLVDVLKTGFENATVVLWGFAPSIAKEVVTGVALSHGASFVVLREMFNAAQRAGDTSACSEPERILDALRKAAATPAVARDIARTLRENDEVNNSSYHPQTCGCPAFYSTAFNGLIEWVQEIKSALTKKE